MNKYGIHLGGSLTGILDAVKECKELGVEVVQLFTQDPTIYSMPKPNEDFYAVREMIPIIFHSPYWVSCFRPKSKGLHFRFIKTLEKRFASSEYPIDYVMHVGVPPKDASEQYCIDTVSKYMHDLYKSIEPANLKIHIENSALPISKHNITLKTLEAVKSEVPGMGLCFDSEHAYCSGEDILNVNWLEYEIIHLNAIPPYVRYGEGLDRHSHTLLYKGKSIIYEMIDKLRDFPGKSYITERRDPTLGIIDMNEIKELLSVSRSES